MLLRDTHQGSNARHALQLLAERDKGGRMAADLTRHRQQALEAAPRVLVAEELMRQRQHALVMKPLLYECFACAARTMLTPCAPIIRPSAPARTRHIVALPTLCCAKRCCDLLLTMTPEHGGANACSSTHPRAAAAHGAPERAGYSARRWRPHLQRASAGLGVASASAP